MKSVSPASGGTVEITTTLRPTVPAGIDLCPFVEELWHGENGSEAFKGLPYLASGSSTKIEDDQGGTMYKWEPAFVEVVAIAGDKDPAKAQGLGGLVLIWMPPPSSVLHSQNVRLKSPP